MANIQVPRNNDFVDAQGNLTKGAQNHLNLIAAKLNAQAAVAAPTSSTPVDTATLITAVTEIQAILAALNAAANSA